MIEWLRAGAPFPPVERALRSPNGLLAAGGDLSTERLLDAYRHGIFPWFSDDEPILWWSPDPRMVLFPAEVTVSRSLRRRLRQGDYAVRCDTAFGEVMAACAGPRAGQPGTWITPAMREAYARLHRLGYAHSVETWIDGRLAGGLYGLAIGRAFFGESMFARETDASKIALVHLARQLHAWEFGVIDCQMSTPHLASLGAREIPRTDFTRLVGELVNYTDIKGNWVFDDGAAE
ncbi:MAG TPA: leucyl/phenylalanyl-tRNA--protein transferase [Pelomicrobium sp.]|nr:leucyl/phenylalanyl-tRNA--protein transferase [Pelomicrobium sp.]